MFSQAGYNLDTPPNPFICCQNNHRLSCLKLTEKARERQKGMSVVRASSGQHHSPWLPHATAPQRAEAQGQFSSWRALTDHQLLFIGESLPVTTCWVVGPSSRHEWEDEEKHQHWGQAPVPSSLLHIPEVSWNYAGRGILYHSASTKGENSRWRGWNSDPKIFLSYPASALRN